MVILRQAEMVCLSLSCVVNMAWAAPVYTSGGPPSLEGWMMYEMKVMAEENRRLKRMYAEMSVKKWFAEGKHLEKSVKTISEQRDGQTIKVNRNINLVTVNKWLIE